MGTEIRLLACQQCKTIEELPDFDGPVERDDLLESLVSRHETNGVKHVGGLFRVEKESWEHGTPHKSASEVQQDVQKSIAEKLSGGETGLGHAYYDLRNTFAEDALKCWQKHHRNPACNEYMSEQMLLKPDTRAERKAAGLPEHRPTTYLCQFCPVHSLVMEAKRKRAGLYK